MAQPELERLVITDTIPPFRLHSEIARAKLEVLSVAPLFGEAIERLHSGGSIVDLLAV
jgi:ribose-phosphate pyrophosphokinase